MQLGTITTPSKNDAIEAKVGPPSVARVTSYALATLREAIRAWVVTAEST